MTPAINNNFGMHTEDSRVFVLVLSAQIACSCILPQQLECNIASGLSSGPWAPCPQSLGPVIWCPFIPIHLCLPVLHKAKIYQLFYWLCI